MSVATNSWLGAWILTAMTVACPTADAQDQSRQLEPAVAARGIPGGLCVQVGAADTTMAVQLARTGRFLVHVLDADPAVVTQTRQRLQYEGV